MNKYKIPKFELYVFNLKGTCDYNVKRYMLNGYTCGKHKEYKYSCKKCVVDIINFYNGKFKNRFVKQGIRNFMYEEK